MPKHCKHKNLSLDKKYYQYTIIDEASRERSLFIYLFIYLFDEYNQFNATQFLMMAIILNMAIKYYDGYIPNIIQTDNGPEFTSKNWHKVKKDIVSLLIPANFIISYIKPFVLEPLDTMRRLNILIVMITTDFINS